MPNNQTSGANSANAERGHPACARLQSSRLESPEDASNTAVETPALPHRRDVYVPIVAISIAIIIAATTYFWPRPAASSGELRRSDLTLTDGKLYPNGKDTPFTGVMFNQASGGQRLSEIPVQAGIIQGLARGWHDNGQLEVEETFVDGKSDGVRKRWHANGKLKSETTIVQGELHGSYTEYHENGQRSIYMTMDHGQPNGTCEAWYPEGGQKSRVEQDHGKVVKQEFFANKASEVAGK